MTVKRKLPLASISLRSKLSSLLILIFCGFVSLCVVFVVAVSGFGKRKGILLDTGESRQGKRERIMKLVLYFITCCDQIVNLMVISVCILAFGHCC